MPEHQPLLIALALLAIGLLGFIAQRIGLCLVKATKEALQGSPWFLCAIFVSGLWVWFYAILAVANNWNFPFERFLFHPIFAIGGFVFGLGAGINQGCSVSTMNHFARGNMSMFFTMLGWFLGWCIWSAVVFYQLIELSYQSQARVEQSTLMVVAIPMLLVTLSVILFVQHQRSRWLGVLLIGCLAGVLYFIEPAWAPSRLIQDTVAGAVHASDLPSLFRFALVMMLMLGMVAAVWLTRDIQFRWPTWRKLVRHLSAGTLMGLGASMALGGNDAQLMMGLPAISIGGMTALAFMVLGIASEHLLHRRLASKHR